MLYTKTNRYIRKQNKKKQNIYIYIYIYPHTYNEAKLPTEFIDHIMCKAIIFLVKYSIELRNMKTRQ